MGLIVPSADMRAALRAKKRQLGFLLNPYRFAVNDPVWSSVEILAHMEGATPIDSSLNNRTLTLFGNAALTSTRSKYGTQAMETAAADGTGASSIRSGVVIVPTQTSAWTLECWAYAIALGASFRYIFQIGNTANSNNRLAVGVNNGRLRLFRAGFNTDHDTVAFPLNQWVYTAMVFNNTSSGNWDSRFYQDTVRTSSASGGVVPPASNGNWSLGIGTHHLSPASGTEWVGCIDEVRLTRNARYNTNPLTIPTGPFPER